MALSNGSGINIDLPVNPSVLARFWSNVSVGTSGECWPWKASLDKNGYGKFSVKLISIPSHRMCAALSGIRFSQSDCICHRCDNPSCCNPHHLFCGSHKDNAVDRDRKHRGCHGERHHGSVLTCDLVRSMRGLERTSRDRALKEFAGRFGLKYECVWRAATGRTWKHLV